MQPVLAAVSGGVDSSVATALVHRAVGDQLTPCLSIPACCAMDEREQVETAFRQNQGVRLVTVNAIEEFLDKLEGVTEPEAKRRIIGETFIRIFEAEARRLGQPRFLVQGTIYPDVVESSAPDRSKAHRIKTHHNVGGLPKDLRFSLVEPLRYLFKDEVRAVGEALGLPAELVWRQPFPGPGLAVRCLGEITWERLERLRAGRAIFTGELAAAGLLNRGLEDEPGQIAQAFAVLLPVRSVGVMGDQRTYQEAIALRAVTTDDFMTADWARLPYDLLGPGGQPHRQRSQGVNRVVYDVTSKPPATIEWEWTRPVSGGSCSRLHYMARCIRSWQPIRSSGRSPKASASPIMTVFTGCFSQSLGGLPFCQYWRWARRFPTRRFIRLLRPGISWRAAGSCWL